MGLPSEPENTYDLKYHCGISHRYYAQLLTPVCRYSKGYIWSMTFLGSSCAGCLVVPVLLIESLDV